LPGAARSWGPTSELFGARKAPLLRAPSVGAGLQRQASDWPINKLKRRAIAQAARQLGRRHGCRCFEDCFDGLSEL